MPQNPSVHSLLHLARRHAPNPGSSFSEIRTHSFRFTLKKTEPLYHRSPQSSGGCFSTPNLEHGRRSAVGRNRLTNKGQGSKVGAVRKGTSFQDRHRRGSCDAINVRQVLDIVLIAALFAGRVIPMKAPASRIGPP